MKVEDGGSDRSRDPHDLECDDDPELFRKRVGKLVKHKPVEKLE